MISSQQTWRDNENKINNIRVSAYNLLRIKYIMNKNICFQYNISI